MGNLTVYPRVRGGTTLRDRQTVANPGLSPRARGNLVQLVAGVALLGSIPACAGEPWRRLY